jgi:hypothetical protein
MQTVAVRSDGHTLVPVNPIRFKTNRIVQISLPDSFFDAKDDEEIAPPKYEDPPWIKKILAEYPLHIYDPNMPGPTDEEWAARKEAIFNIKDPISDGDYETMLKSIMDGRKIEDDPVPAI